MLEIILFAIGVIVGYIVASIMFVAATADDNEAKQNQIDGILFTKILKASLMPGRITFAIPNKDMDALKDTHIFVCYAINKEDFKRIKQQLIKE